MNTRKVRTGIVLSLILAFVVLVVIALYGDLPRMLDALAHFRWAFFPLILALTLVNYCGRFIKWQYYLRCLKVDIARGRSLLIFLSGLSMAITPGKVGELLKSYLLRQSTQVPMSRTAPIIVAERLSDGIAMLCLASAGLLLYHVGWQVLLALLVVGLVGILCLQNRSLMLALIGLCERLPLVAKVALSVRSFYESAYTLLQWRPLLLAVFIGILSWTGECAALYFVYTGLGIAASFDLFIKALFIMAVSSLVGSASGLPGGLGTADGSVLGLTRVLVINNATIGGAATLLIRFCTLWFGLLVGVCAFLLYRLTQHVDVSTEQADAVGRWTHDRGTQPMQEYQSTSPVETVSMSTGFATSPSASTGENV